MHERAGDRKAAEEVFLEVLKKNPEHAPTLNYLGYMWAENGVNLERAQEMLTRAVGQEPDNGAYVDSLGWVYFRLGQARSGGEVPDRCHAPAAARCDGARAPRRRAGQARRHAARAAALSHGASISIRKSKDVEKLRSKIAEIERGKLDDAAMRSRAPLALVAALAVACRTGRPGWRRPSRR